MIDLINNPLFVGGGAIGIFGALSLWFKSGLLNIYSLIKREIITTVEIREDDPAFGYLESYISEHDFSKKNKSITLKTAWKKSLPYFEFLPSEGIHFFKDDGIWFMLSRVREKLQNANSNKSYTDTFYLSSIFLKREQIDNLFKKCYEEFKRSFTIDIYYFVEGGWNWCSDKEKISETTMVLTNEQKEIFNDVKSFVKSREWYETNGVPWRRGYLFYGNPGNGKSRLIIEIARIIGYKVYYVNLTDNSLTDGKLTQMLAGASNNSIIVIEEIDTVFEKRKKVEEKVSGNSISFGGLLNVLDGVVAREGRIIVMTTNHLEKLDGALTRPGRIDRRIFFSNATREQKSEMVDRFLPKNSEKIKEELYEMDLSMAELQEFCIERSEKYAYE